MAKRQHKLEANPLLISQRSGRVLGLCLCIFLALLPILSVSSLIASQDHRWSDALDILTSNQTIYAVKIASWQAFLSTVGSLILGIVAARALLRRGAIWLHRPIIYFSFLAIVTPTTVAGVALVSIWGRKGLFHDLTGASMPAYGLWLVILAHIFFNAPLVMRACLSAFSAVPETNWRMANQLGMNSLALWKWLEWPAIRPLIASLTALIFLQCFSSFSLVLMLGGGPKVTTLEVAIYTAVRFEFNLFAASILALLQLCISAAILVFLARKTQTALFLTSVPPTPFRRDKHALGSLISDYGILTIFCLLVIAPLISLIIDTDIARGITIFTKPIFWKTLLDSLLIAISSAVATCVLATVLIITDQRQVEAGFAWRRRLGSLSVSIYLVMPAIVFGTSAFILLHHYIDVFSHAFWLVLFANILLSLPFAVRLLEGRLAQTHQQIDKLAISLNIRGNRRFWLLILPSMPKEYGVALGVSAALSLGDLGVIALFGSREFQTLPWLLYQLFNRYGGAQADMLAIFMLFLTALLYFGFYTVIQMLVGMSSKRPLESVNYAKA